MSCEALRELFKDELEEAYKNGERHGEAKGKDLEKRGKDAAQREIILNMHKKGCTVEQISDLVNMPVKDAENIISSELVLA